MDIKVSVIVPIYNSEKYLKRCLDSIIRQTLSDIEIICVDNGSTDKSPEIIREYSKIDSRIKFLFMENKGPGGARNYGIENANGEFINFVDSDDWIDVDYLVKLYYTATSNNANISCGGLIREHKNRKRYRANFKKVEIFEDIQDKLRVCKVPEMCYTVNKLYKKEVLNKCKLRFPENVFFEDVPFMFKALFYFDKLVTVPKTFYHYFDNPASIVKTSSAKKALDKQLAYKEVREFSREHDIKLFEEDLVAKTSYVKFLKIPIIKSKHFDDCVKHYLFGIIYVGEKNEKIDI